MKRLFKKLHERLDVVARISPNHRAGNQSSSANQVSQSTYRKVVQMV